jgi:hypothetical protein
MHLRPSPKANLPLSLFPPVKLVLAEKASVYPSTSSGRTEARNEIIGEFPFMLSQSKHEKSLFQWELLNRLSFCSSFIILPPNQLPDFLAHHLSAKDRCQHLFEI